MNIKIIAVGDYKETYLKEMERSLLDRFFSHNKQRMLSGDITLPEIVIVRDAPDHNPEAAKQTEAKNIMAKLGPQDHVILLHLQGKRHSDFFSVLHPRKTNVFVLGGSNGFGDEVLKRANQTVQLSALTYPHQLARITLLDLLSSRPVP